MIRVEMMGEWHLAATTSVTAELAVADDEAAADPEAVAGWLNGFDGVVAAKAQAATGLVLTITPVGTFTEQVTGKPCVQQWFDVDGMLADEVSPFNGSVVDNGKAAWLKPRGIPDFARPVDGRYGAAVLRYDDGDTQIADGLRMVGDDLVRTVNVVTDEQYLDRVVLVYRRPPAPPPR